MNENSFNWINLRVAEHHLMDRPEKQCESDEVYDFIGCVKTYTAKIVGCRPGWEDWSSKKYPL